VAAAGLADVFVGDPDPAVALRGDDHRLEQSTVCLLEIGSARDLGARLANPKGERVAHSFELV
jgi:hypothetical protein